MDAQGASIVLETARHRITGQLRLPREGYRSRLTEYLNAPDQQFIPLTDARIELLDGGGAPEQHEFLLVAVSGIVLARPA